MTVSTAIATATLAWTGVETTFNPGFQAQNVGDVSVIFIAPGGGQTPLTLGTHYGLTLDGAGNVTITPIALPTAPGNLLIQRNSSQLQADVFQDGVPYSAEVVQQAIDASALRDQEIRRDLAAAIVSVLAVATPAQFQALYATWLASLPTNPPAAHGTFWNNGGVAVLS